MKPPLLTVKNLTVWYQQGENVIQNLNLTLGQNQIVGLIGRNGAGKSTLINTIASTGPNSTWEAVEFFGKAVDFKANSFKTMRSVVFDEDHSFEYFSFNEYLAYVFSAYQKPIPDLQREIAGLHFEKYTDVLFKDLSLGNRKKAFLITSFGLKLPLMILDEPVNGLDFDSTEFLYQMTGEYRESGTILFSSHVMESVTMNADQVLILEQGEILKDFVGKEINSDIIREALR